MTEPDRFIITRPPRPDTQKRKSHPEAWRGWLAIVVALAFVVWLCVR